MNDDRRLIAETLSGRSAAFGELVRKYQDRVVTLTTRVLGNREDGLDAAQEAFAHAYQALPAFKGDSEFFTWLYRIAFNAAVSLKRKRRPVVRLQFADGAGAEEPADPLGDVSPTAGLERQEAAEQVLAALNRLSVDHRAVLVLKDIDGLPYEEIAAVVGVPVGTVRSRIHRARLELRTLLGGPD